MNFPVLHPTMPDDREARIKFGCPTSFDWAIIEPHEHQAQRNHDQTLKRLAKRGGLSPCEAVAVLEDRPWHKMTDEAAILRLKEIIVAANMKPKE